MESVIIGIVIAIAALITISCIVLIILFYFGLMSAYHPMKKAKDNQIKVACVGDSITYGCMVKNRNKNNYPALLNKLLGDSYCVNNFGYTNRTAIKSGDYPLVNEKIYKQSLEFSPDIVIILLGTNDSKKNNWNKDKFVEDYSEIIGNYLALNSSPKIFMLTPTPLFEVNGKVMYQLRKDVVDNEICPAVREIAKTKNINLIDMRNIFENKKQLFADGVHPNAKGSAVFAQNVYQNIKNL